MEEQKFNHSLSNLVKVLPSLDCFKFKLKPFASEPKTTTKQDFVKDLGGSGFPTKKSFMEKELAQ